jgi:AcrR family transcriptional regulator
MVNSSRGEDTRSKILHTALELFSKNGYDATSIAEICQKAEVSKGAFYYHFPSKQDLFLALMAGWLDELDGMLKEQAASAADIPQAIENMAGVSGSLFEALEGGFPILLEFWTQANRQPEIWQRAVEPYRNYLSYFAEVIQNGKVQDAFEVDLDPELAARLLMGVAMGLLLQASFDPEGADWQEVTRSGIKILLNGMR